MKIIVNITTAAFIYLFTHNLRALCAEEFGEWKAFKKLDGVDFRVKQDSKFPNGKTMWWVEFRNRYKKEIHLSFTIESSTVTSVEQSALRDRVSVKPSKTTKGWKGVKTSGHNVKIFIGQVRFGEDSGPYEDLNDQNN